MKLKIIHKGLLILLLPFAIETTLFGFLFVLNESAENAAQQARCRYKFIQIINLMMEDSGIAWGSILNRMFTTNNLNRFRQVSPADYRFDVECQLKELRAIPLVSENRDNILITTESMCKLQCDMLDVLESNKESFGGLGNVPLLRNRVRALHDNFYKTRLQFLEIKRLLMLEQDKLEEAIKRDGQRRDLVKTLLIAGFVGQLLLAAGLLLLLLKNITNRLNRLVGNAHLLPTLTPLKESVSGDDEIAYLDNVLHDASTNLINAAKNRQMIMNMITHDIRSPLMTSSILVERLTDELSPNDAGVNTVTRLKSTFTHLYTLVEDLLTLDKFESGELELNLEYFSLKDLVTEAIETVRPQAEKRSITLSNSVPVGDVVADRGRLLQVLNNLLTNSIKFSPNNKVVEVKAQFESDKVTVTVVDQGKGISPVDVPHVFERFYQSAETKKGFGLGLAICKMIVVRHAGSIGVESEPEKGSSFWFTLPIDN